MVGSNEDHGMSRRPGVEDWGWSSTGRVLGGQTIERLDDAVCGLHHARGDEKRRFLGLASKPRSMVSPSLTSKSVAPGFPVWVSKPTATVWWFELQNHCDKFFGLSLKTKWAMVCRLRHKTDGRMKTAWDTRQDLAACFVWKQVGLEFPSLISRLV
jgi:hypothetical protein